MQLISTNLLPVPLAPVQYGTGTDSSVQFGLKYCPSMDLVAIYAQSHPTAQDPSAQETKKSDSDLYYVDDDEDELTLDVYRLNGQKVFTTTIDSKGKTVGIVNVAWREDGVLLAIASSDNTVRLVNSLSGKIERTFETSSEHPLRVHSKTDTSGGSSPSTKRKSAAQELEPRKRVCTPTSISYSTHFSANVAAKAKDAAINEANSRILDDLRGLHADVDELLGLDADLPREFANIDVEQYLPRLPVLPSNGFGEDDVFATKTSIDALLHTSKLNTVSSGTDIVVVAQSDAHVHIRIFDSFKVGDIDLNHALNLPKGCILGNIKDMITHPLLERLYVLVEEQEREGKSTSPKKQSKKQQTQSNSLHLLSLDLRFLQRSSLTLPVLATKATQLNNLIRYLQQIEQQLARETKSAFDLPVRFIRTLEEDLKVQDGEGSTFETSAYHALLTGEVSGKFKEWLVEILGDRGVKRWEKAVAECLDTVRRLTNENWNPAVERAGVAVSRLSGLVAGSTFGVDKTIVDELRQTIDVMAVIGEDLLQEVNSEIFGFRAFIAWLKGEVEAAGLEDTSEKLDEMRENSDHAEVRNVLKYISKRLQNTSVRKYIRDEQAPDAAEDVTTMRPDFYTTFCEARKRGKEQFLPPSMKFLTARLKAHCDRLFEQIGQQLQENVLVEQVCPLTNPWDANIADYWIVNEPDCPVLHVLAKSTDSAGTVTKTQVKLDARPDGVRTTSKMLEEGSEILDIKCTDTGEAYMLVRRSGIATIFGIGSSSLEEITTCHVFGSTDDNYSKLGLTPSGLEVNGRKGRRTLTVLDDKGRGYGVFDLDSAPEGDSGEGDEVMRG